MNRDMREFQAAVWACCYEASYYSDRKPAVSERDSQGHTEGL